MAGTMTCAGLDVHARSTHAAAIDVADRGAAPRRFGAGSERAGRVAAGAAAAGAGLLRGRPDRVRALRVPRGCGAAAWR